jgi:hypothetical protein
MILLHLGIAVLLGFADLVETYTQPKLGLKQAYKSVFWLEVACATTALVIFVCFVKIGAAVAKKEDVEGMAGDNLEAGEENSQKIQVTR